MRIATRPLWFRAASGVLASIAAVFIGGGTTHADVVVADSEGYGLQVDLQLLNVVSVDLLGLTPGQVSAGSAPAPYAVSASAVPVSVDVGASLGPVLGTSVDLQLAGVDGLLNSYANSNVSGSPGLGLTDAFGEVNALSLGIGNASVTLPLGSPVAFDFLNISADTVSSTSMINGDYGALVASGNSIIENLIIELNGVEIDLLPLLGANGSIDAQGFLTAAPNTQILSLGGVAGLDLILNQQIITGDGISLSGIEVNAIQLSFNGVDLGLPLLSETLNGNVYVGHSRASMTASIPEPATLPLFMGALALVAHRRRNRAR